MNFLDFFRAQKNCLVIVFLMDTEILEFQPNLCPWQLFKELSAQNDCPVIGFQAKKNLGQFEFSVGGKSRFCKGNRKECKIWSKVPRNGTKTLRLHILG